MNAWHEVATAAHDHLRACRLCPRDCGVDRLSSDRGAYCRLDAQAWVYKELLSVGEEPALSPTWLVDLGGCSLRCQFCSEWDHVTTPQRAPAVPLDPAWFAARLALRRSQGARTVSFAGGDPTVSLAAVARALAACTEPLPVVWNCNALGSAVAWQLLCPVVTTWVLDAKFGQADCARALAAAGGFDALAAEAACIDAVLGAQGPAGVDARGRAGLDAGGQHPPASYGLPRLIVRHLLMPGHLGCCTRPVLERLAARLDGCPADVAQVNLMTAFVPRQGGLAALQRWNTAAEVESAVAMAHQLLGSRLLVDGRPLPAAPP
jgi:putative pyruvate formate lyase activating enzyme